jgi:hypothetical protein
LLTDCATDLNKHWVLTQADQMTATFTTIGTELTKLRRSVTIVLRSERT